MAMSNFDMNPEKFRSTMTSINHGSVMQAAAKNLQKEMLRDAQAAGALQEGASRAVIDMQDFEQARVRRGGLLAQPGSCNSAV
jgi:hypothetical protein